MRNNFHNCIVAFSTFVAAYTIPEGYSARSGAHSLLRAPFRAGGNLDNFRDLAIQINFCEAWGFIKTIKQEKKEKRDYAQSHYRPTSQFNYRARCPARLLNWRSIRNNYTLLARASRSFPVLMATTKGVRPMRLFIIT
jgi:hypothetical protein